jgi:hypothetical protein
MIPNRTYRQLTFIGLLLLLLGLLAKWYYFQPQPEIPGLAPAKVTELAHQVRAIERAEERVAQKVWTKELLAEKCGRVMEDLWDRLNLVTNKWMELSQFSFGELQGPAMAPARKLACGIELLEQNGPGRIWTVPTWRDFLMQMAEGGWQIARTEFRHLEFDTDKAEHPARSRFYFSAHLERTKPRERAILEGELVLGWQAGPVGAAPVPQRLETRSVSIRRRAGEPRLKEILAEKVSPPAGSFFIDPLILYDLDGDGLSEVVLAASNLVFQRGPEGH